MDISDKIWYYGSMAGIAIALVGIAIGLLGLITDAHIFIVRCLIGLAICTSCFVRARRVKQEAEVRELQDWLSRGEEAAHHQEEHEKPNQA